jgi:hypothetical protein
MGTMGVAARERDVERAWLRHEPARARVPNEARRAARAFRDGLARDGDRIKLTYQSPDFRQLLNDWARKGTIGRGRALARIRASIAPASVDVVGAALTLMWLMPHEGLIRVPLPTFSQPGVLVAAAHVSRGPAGFVREASFPVLETPTHALGRMFERSPSINATAALMEAARAFMGADREAVEAVRLKGSTLILPAGRGLLLCVPILGPDLENKLRIVGRANTFIRMEQAAPDQRAIAAAADPERSVLAAAAR